LLHILLAIGLVVISSAQAATYHELFTIIFLSSSRSLIFFWMIKFAINLLRPIQLLQYILNYSRNVSTGIVQMTYHHMAVLFGSGCDGRGYFSAALWPDFGAPGMKRTATGRIGR